MSVLRIYDKFTTNDCRKIRIYDILREKRNFTNPGKPLVILDSVKGIKSSGSGASPNRRYSPRPARCAAEPVTLIREDSGTDSIVWMREENILIGIQTFRKQLRRESIRPRTSCPGSYFELKCPCVSNPAALSLLGRIPFSK